MSYLPLGKPCYASNVGGMCLESLDKEEASDSHMRVCGRCVVVCVRLCTCLCAYVSVRVCLSVYVCAHVRLCLSLSLSRISSFSDFISSLSFSISYSLTLLLSCSLALLPLFSGRQLAVDTTLVSALQGNGEPRRGAADHDGVALMEVQHDKKRTYPGRGARARLVVLALDVGADSRRLRHSVTERLQLLGWCDEFKMSFFHFHVL